MGMFSHSSDAAMLQAPTTGYEKWVGKKATIRLINYSWMRKYADMILEANGAVKHGGGRVLLATGPRLDVATLRKHAVVNNSTLSVFFQM